ncbi:twin-arginine translocase subunit TatC [Microlunatus parietis]|uniref:Sec-independent protein translocase protein TatC n=1 Tax=Microlunatus parietis TaxID=682979 RepID=A0A7Y9I413_9ACTN|nr:twin-arginine translocase subunit TatC [Microlunatus parietis]NYE69580.1 sec-independent protein translocase protein TatC [Microlunatus parietis]
MTLFEHLAELRYRLVICVLAILAASIVAFIFNGPLVSLLTRPYILAGELVKETRPEIKMELILDGVTSPFTVSLAIAGLAGLVVSSPVWLYQVWAFIVPGLLAKEKKWSLIVVGAAVPLFLVGVSMGYFIMPRAVAILVGFTPEDQQLTNLQGLPAFLGFMVRLMVIFGLAFEVPLFIVMLNVVGVLPAKMISKYRAYIIFGMFVFAAIATPTPDAFTMLLLALPMTVLVILSEAIAYALDRRKGKLNKSEDSVDHSVDDDAALRALEAEESGTTSDEKK